MTMMFQVTCPICGDVCEPFFNSDDTYGPEGTLQGDGKCGCKHLIEIRGDGFGWELWPERNGKFDDICQTIYRVPLEVHRDVEEDGVFHRKVEVSVAPPELVQQAQQFRQRIIAELEEKLATLKDRQKINRTKRKIEAAKEPITSISIEVTDSQLAAEAIAIFAERK